MLLRALAAFTLTWSHVALGLSAPSPSGAIVTREYVMNVSYFQVNPDKYGNCWVQGINGMLPGPEVRVRQGERLRVVVNNQLQTEVVSIHWHGFEMRAAQEYDGAMKVTQCGIQPGNTFVYDFIVDEHPGTYQYHEHAHLEHVAARGLFGALIVDPREGDHEPWQYTGDSMIMINDWWPYSPHETDLRKWGGLTRPPTVSKAGNDVGLLTFHNLLINGKGGYAVLHDFGALDMGYVTKKTKVTDLFEIQPKFGETWRLRVENGGALFALRFRIDKHRLTVIQTDAADVEPYDCDVVSMSTGERFDVLVTFNQTPGSYFMRAETLEDGFGFRHGQLGVVRYDDTAKGILPNKGYQQRDYLWDHPELVTINCIDQGPISSSCRPVTDLRKKDRGGQHTYMGTANDDFHDFEVNFRGFGKPDDSHFTRLIDLSKNKNTFENQFDGEYVQFRPPAVPFSHVRGTDEALHPNSLAMHVEIGETIRVIFQIQDRSAHPWHLHGHKFAVLGIGFPDYETECDVVFCRSKPDSGWWARDGMPPGLLDPEVAPLKDTVHVPAGGWAVIQFKADNPGWWFFHCHMLIHVHDGMGMVLVEGDSSVIPERLTNLTYLHDEKGFPSCEDDIKELEVHGHHAVSCPCWENPEIFLDNNLRSTYKCARPSLCGQIIYSILEPKEEERLGNRDRASGLWWRLALLCVELSGVVFLFWVLKSMKGREQQFATGIQEHIARSTKKKNENQRGISKSQAKLGLVKLPGMELKWSAQHVSPSGFTVHKSEMIEGCLPRGSVLCLIGKDPVTLPWLRFFAGSLPRAPLKVMGSLCMEGKPDYEWNRTALRAVRSFVHDVKAYRPTLTVTSVLDLVLQLQSADSLFVTTEERQSHLAKYMNIFNLVQHAGTEVGKLPQDVLMRMRVCQQLLLPRPLIVVQDPLGELDAKAAVEMTAMFRTLANTIGVTIVFSAMGSISGKASHAVTHAMLLESRCLPMYGSCDELRECCEANGQPVPDNLCAVEHCANLHFNGMLKFEREGKDAMGQRKNSGQRGSVQGGNSPVSGQMPPASPGGSAISRPSSPLPPTSPPRFINFMAGFNRDNMEAQFLQHKPRLLIKQFWVLLQYQLCADLDDQMTIYKLSETLGIALCAGCVWFRKGSGETQTELGETVGVLFFTTALWTVPPVFQALGASQTLFFRFVNECFNGMYPLWVGVLSFAISSFFFSAVWCCVWQTLAYTMSDVGADLGSMMMMHLVLAMNVFTMRTIGLVLGLVISNTSLGVVIANLVAQLFMLTNGFYTKLPSWFNFVTYFSIPRYTFRALLKLEYSWKDTWTVHSYEQGIVRAGFPSRFILAEYTGFFQLMRMREMDVMESPHDANVLPEIAILTLISCTLFTFYLLALGSRVRKLEHTLKKPTDDTA